VFGPFEAVFPARARVEYDALLEPFLRVWGGSGRRDGADAVGEERDAEGCARVEVLADEEVAVVEGGGGEGCDGLVGGVRVGGLG
jgi:hypothetical protein